MMVTAELAEALNAKATCELVPKMFAVWSGEDAQAVSMNRRGTLPGVLPVAVGVAAAEVVPVCAENGLSEAVAVPLPVGEAAALTDKVAAAVAVEVCVDESVAAADEVLVCVGSGAVCNPSARMRLLV